jgi:multidrug transporter EmrE-like cation transporter
MSIFTVIPGWIWIIISGLFFAAGEFLSKKFALNPGWGIFIFIILVDIASITAWLPAIFQKNELSTTGVIWSIVSLILTAAIGILLFGEKLTMIKILGFFLGAVAVALLSL